MTDLNLINFLEWLDADQRLLAAPTAPSRTSPAPGSTPGLTDNGLGRAALLMVLSRAPATRPRLRE